MKIIGRVVKGAGRGKALGFPTANIDAAVDGAEEGIYVGHANGRPSLIFIGAAETFGEEQKKIEVYLLDFDEDLYGKELEVEMIKKLRDNQKFDSAQALVEQIKLDELAARRHFGI